MKRRKMKMANKSVFASVVGRLLPRPDAVNSEGAPAYKLTPKQKLAQLAATGCVNRTFYAEAREQVAEVLPLIEELDPTYVAQVAVYAREKGYMKDMPALLAAALTVKDPALAAKVFNRVIDNGRMLRNFVQIMRSGAVGRKSLGSGPKRMVQKWLNEATDTMLIRAAVGKDPSLADVIKMVHPKPASKAREALFAYLIGKDHDAALLPIEIKEFEAFKEDQNNKVPNVPFQMLTALDLKTGHWRQIADDAGWHMTRMNLNTFARHGVLKGFRTVRKIATRLRDEEAIANAKVFPYQLMVAYLMAADTVPRVIKNALQDAMELATKNVPALSGNVAVCPDISGSMNWPITGYRPGASSVVRCVDVAALITATVIRKNPDATVLPFHNYVERAKFNSRDSVMTNASKLACLPRGGTNCSAPLKELNQKKAAVDLVILVSDNESWVDATRRSDTGLMREWSVLKGRNPNAKLVCIDLVPNGTTQAVTRGDILNIGGFSDAVFGVIASFAGGDVGVDHWVGEIERVTV